MNIEVLMNESFVNATKDVVYKVIMELSKIYNFENEEACRNVGLSLSVKQESKPESKPKSKPESKPKCRFPLPYSGELDDLCCQGLRQNQGLYTQCKVNRMDSSEFCKSCQTSAECNNGVPEYGTIESRLKAYTEGIEYKDPSGKSPVPYAKIMKKLNISREEVEEEAGKLNMKINAIHFETDAVKKSGRPAKLEKKKPEGEVKAKGRPKKAKKVLELAGEEEDLFASLVMSANKQDDSEDENDEDGDGDTVTMSESDDEKWSKLAEEEEAKLEAEKEAKLALENAAKLAAELEAKLAAEKEAKLAAEKEAKLAAEKEAKLAAENAAKLEAEKLAAKVNVAKEVEKIEAKKKADEKESKKKAEEKEAKKKAANEKKESERLEKEAKKKADEEEKAAKKKADEEEKAAKKKADEEEKAAKKKAYEDKKEAERLEKEAKKKATEDKKPKKEEKKPAAVEVSNKVSISQVVEEEEQDIVKRFEFEGKKYLKSKKTGIIYNMDQDVIGKWNEAKQRIDFDSIEEESCDEYDE